MRHGTTGRRTRNHRSRGGRNGGSHNQAKVFDSNGPDVRIRGTAHQIHEKYIALSKEAHGSGDLVLEENYLQYAEHYRRIVNRWQETLTTYERTGVIEDHAPVVKEQKPSVEQPVAKREEEDLGLPESITGVKTEVKTETKEVLEDA